MNKKSNKKTQLKSKVIGTCGSKNRVSVTKPILPLDEKNPPNPSNNSQDNSDTNNPNS